MSAPALTVLAANIETAARTVALHVLIREHQPDIVVVSQAYRARRFLRSIGGYKAHQHTRLLGGEGPDIAILVRHGIGVEKRRPLRMRRPWTGPKSLRAHSPRVYPVLIATAHSVTWRIVGIHLPPGGPSGGTGPLRGRNKPAYAESVEALVRYFDAHPRSRIVAAGDWNATAAELEVTKQRVGGVLLSKAHVDHCIARNAKGRVERLPTPEGAHGWSLFVIEEAR